MKLSTLKKKAQQATKYRGHRMQWGDAFGNATTLRFGQHGTCRDCGAHVWLNTHPAPNSIGISGLGVAVHCKNG